MTATAGKYRLLLPAMGILGGLIMLAGVTAPLLSHQMTTIAVHHLLHAGMAAGAGLLALAVAPRRSRGERAAWVWPAVIAPVVGLFLMWPSEYAHLISHPWLHVLDHLSIALVTFLAVYAAQAYVCGLGWLMLVVVVAMDAAAAGGFGVSRGPSFLLTARTTRNPAVVNPLMQRRPPKATATLHAMGAQLYQTMGCSGCHSVDGSKGVGPSWKNLAGYPQKLSNGKTALADYHFLCTMILDPGKVAVAGYPAGVMPDTYKSMLAGPHHPRETKLNALIWYINSLSNRSGPDTRPPVPDKLPR